MNLLAGVIRLALIPQISTWPGPHVSSEEGAQLITEQTDWVDPRTGEQVLRDFNGRYTPIGTRLRGMMQKQKVNKTDWWTAWVDRDFVLTGDGAAIDDPWGTTL